MAHVTYSAAPSAAKRRSGLPSYLAVYKAAPAERIGMIRAGVRAADAKRIVADLKMSQAETFKALRLSVATVNKKAKQNKTLTESESERVLGIVRLVGQVEALVEESGEGKRFDATAWVSRWLNEPVRALGGARPIEFMDTMEGQALVSDTIARMQTGAYA